MEAFVSIGFSIIIYLFKQNSELTYALAPSFKIILQFGMVYFVKISYTKYVFKISY